MRGVLLEKGGGGKIVLVSLLSSFDAEEEKDVERTNNPLPPPDSATPSLPLLNTNVREMSPTNQTHPQMQMTG